MKKVLERIKPTRREKIKINKIIKDFYKKIKIKHCELILGGSIGKDTWVHNNHDIDIYARFTPKKYKNISKTLEKELRKHFKVKKLHGSRDYFNIKIDNYTIEVIPILKIKKPSEAENITDISPFHTKYVRKFKNKDEIRLAKAFFRAQKVYGAESYIKGFSGYLVELLTIHYQTFNNLIKNIAKWKSKTLIGDANVIKELNKSKKTSPLIFIDPTDQRRNAAAALSKEKYNLIIKAAKKYLKHPSDLFFYQEEFRIPETKDKITILEVIPLKGKKDVIGSKLLYTFNYIKKQLKNNDFKLKKADWNWNQKAIFYYITDKKVLSSKKRHYGPPLTNKKAVKEFRKKWKNKKIHKTGNKIYINIPRKHTIAEKYIQQLIQKDKNIKTKVKKIKVLK